MSWWQVSGGVELESFAELRTGERSELRYSDDQPRDEGGRFGSGGGSSSTTTGGIHAAASRWTGNPADCARVRTAAEAIVRGEEPHGGLLGRHAPDDARALISGVQNGEKSDATLYRGIMAENPDYQPGQTVNFALGSFTESQDFATTAASQIWSGHEGTPVVFNLEPGATNLSMQSLGIDHESEHVTGGTFTVTGTTPYTSPDNLPGLQVNIRQEEVVHAG